MVVAGLVFAGLAAALHVYIFVLESLIWTSARTRAVFGTTPQEAQTTKALAFNQGFYNLFLAVITVVGIALMVCGRLAINLPSVFGGAALVFAGVGSMAAAALVLALSSPDKLRAAVTQGAFPVLAIVLLVWGLAR